MVSKLDDIFEYLPIEEADRLFKKNYRMGGNIDYTHMGFTHVYKSLLNIVPKHFTIIDLGCCYAPQCYYFKDYKKYIGVDVDDEERFATSNATHYSVSIQKFIKDVLPELNLNLKQTFAICSYVPDDEATELARKTFPNILVYYPNGGFEQFAKRGKENGFRKYE